MPSALPRFKPSLALAVALLAATGCSEDVTAPASPTHLEIVRGPPAKGAPGAVLIDTLRVRLVDENGDPQAGQTITWVTQQGGGTITPLANVTDAQGIASARWTLGPASGLNEIEVRTVDDSALAFQTSGEAFKVDFLDSNLNLGCGLQQGDVWCWGLGSWVSTDPVSEGPSNPFGDHARGPGLVSQGRGFTSLAVGYQSVCAIDASQTVECFGPSGSSMISGLPTMRRLAGAENLAFCGLAAADSTAWCWDVVGGSAAPVPSSPAFIDLEMDDAAGQGLTACGRLVDSTAACWGAGPLGDGSFNPSPTPVVVSGGLKFTELAVGEDFSCGRQSSGDVWCWGRNSDLQLGSVGSDSPLPVLAATQISSIAAAFRTVIATRLGSVVRWGYFGNGIGNPLTPLASVAGLPVVDFASNDVSCLLLVDGQAYCFTELFIASSGIDIDDYSPVKPVVEP